MLNSCTFMGRLTKDAEIRTTQSGKMVASFIIAVDRDFDRDKTDFISCTAWGKLGEIVGTYYKKGMLVVVCGSLQSRSWKDKDGNNRISWEINLKDGYFAESKKESAPTAPKFEEIEDKEDLPF